jgi:hypothetical protein
MFFPGGLGELVYRGRDLLLRAVADRRGIRVPSLIADDRTEQEDTEMLIRRGVSSLSLNSNEDPTTEMPVVGNGSRTKVGTRVNGARARAKTDAGANGRRDR